MKHHIRAIAQDLNETNRGAVRQLTIAYSIIGYERMQDLVQQALIVQAQGGMLTADGAKKRTTGGIFFYLLRPLLRPEDRKQVFGYAGAVGRNQPPVGEGVPASSMPSFTLSPSTLKHALTLPELPMTSVQATVRGTLRQETSIATVGKSVMIVWHVPAQKSSAGTPALSLPSVTITVYMAIKQWRAIEREAIAGQSLVLRGIAFYDPAFEGLVLSVQKAFVSQKILKQSSIITLSLAIPFHDATAMQVYDQCVLIHGLLDCSRQSHQSSLPVAQPTNVLLIVPWTKWRKIHATTSQSWVLEAIICTIPTVPAMIGVVTGLHAHPRSSGDQYIM